MAAPGDFSFIQDQAEREALTHDYIVVTNVKAWDALKRHDSSKTFFMDTWGEPWETLRTSTWQHHSGASLALSFRALEMIAKSGWDAYVALYTRTPRG